jgi:YggT family protein
MQLLLLIIYRILQIYFYILIVYIILTWTPIVNTQFGRILKKLTDPFLNIFRGLLVIGMFDLTPMLGLILYQLFLSILARYL